MKSFSFIDFLEYDLILYFRYAVLGGRRYLLGEKDVNLPRARKHFRRMYVLDKVLKVLFFGSLLYYIFLMISSSFGTYFVTQKC